MAVGDARAPARKQRVQLLTLAAAEAERAHHDERADGDKGEGADRAAAGGGLRQLVERVGGHQGDGGGLGGGDVGVGGRGGGGGVDVGGQR